MTERDESDDSSECYLDSHETPPQTHLRTEWDAIESFLYNEDHPEISNLRPALIHECRLWRESFPYLRIRGRKIENPEHEARLKKRREIIDKVVDCIIGNMQGLNLENNRPAAASKESYFERGKIRSQPSPQVGNLKPALKGILKSSPEGRRNTPLPRIGAKNYWLDGCNSKRHYNTYHSSQKIALPPINSKFH